MTDERQLADQLSKLGLSIGRSKSGRLLRVDDRDCAEPLDNESLVRVIACSALKELYLQNHSGCLNQQIQQLAALKNLRVLDLENSDFTDESVEQLAVMAKLQVLNVRGSRVTQECVVRMRKIMINTRIII